MNMLGLVLIGAAGVGYWAWKTREDRAMRFGDVAAVAAAIAAFALFRKHEISLGVLALGGAGWWYWFRKNGSDPGEAMTADQARQLLDLPRSASPEDIRAAHRRLIARVHPDAGGSADLTRQVNAARDVLLSRRPI